MFMCNNSVSGFPVKHKLLHHEGEFEPLHQSWIPYAKTHFHHHLKQHKLGEVQPKPMELYLICMGTAKQILILAGFFAHRQ